MPTSLNPGSLVRRSPLVALASAGVLISLCTHGAQATTIVFEPTGNRPIADPSQGITITVRAFPAVGTEVINSLSVSYNYDGSELSKRTPSPNTITVGSSSMPAGISNTTDIASISFSIINLFNDDGSDFYLVSGGTAQGTVSGKAGPVPLDISTSILNIVPQSGGGSCSGPSCCPTLNVLTGPLSSSSAPSSESCFPCPIIIDTRGDGYSLTDTPGGVSFDFNGDGIPIQTAWTTPNTDDAFLVLDRNGNGLIDNGTELFGNYTEQSPSARPNGFSALAEYDDELRGGNVDGLIDSRDSIYSQLRLWLDSNHDGISQSEELTPLNSKNVRAISLNYRSSKLRDSNGNVFRYRARVSVDDDPQAARWAWDVFFTAAP